MYNLKELPQFKISRGDEIKVQNIVMDKLNLSSLNQLRDKFEGVAFYNKYRARFFSILAVYDYLELPKPNHKDLILNDVDHSPFKIENCNFRIINTKIYEPFMVPCEYCCDFIIFTYISDNIIYLTGFLAGEELGDRQIIDTNVSAINSQKYIGSISDWSSFHQMSLLRRKIAKL